MMYGDCVSFGWGVAKSKGPVIFKSVMPCTIFEEDEFLTGSENYIKQHLRHTRLSVGVGGGVLTFEVTRSSPYGDVQTVLPVTTL
jgi:hypothetical protein